LPGTSRWSSAPEEGVNIDEHNSIVAGINKVHPKPHTVRENLGSVTRVASREQSDCFCSKWEW
jgi:hypothetical protein